MVFVSTANKKFSFFVIPFPSRLIFAAGVAELEGTNRVMLIQSALVVSALSTFLQLFPIGSKKGFRLGAGLPVIMGTSFAYVASMQAIAADVGIAAIFGAQIIGGIIAMIIGFFIEKIRKVFPPLVTGTVVFTIGLSLYPTAVNYMAGGASSANYGHWTNWLVAIITLAIVTFLNHFTKMHDLRHLKNACLCHCSQIYHTCNIKDGGF